MQAQSRSADAPHLLLFGWYQPGTGFTRVLEALLPTLAKHFVITWMGVGYRGPAFSWSDRVYVEPTNLHGGDLVGAYSARERWSELQPDAVFALNDPWYLLHYSRALGDVLGSVPMVGYMPLDGQICDPSLLSELIGFSQLVTYTETAAADLASALSAARIPTPTTHAGHGVDLSQFHPLLSADQIGDVLPRMALAQGLFQLDQPAFVILNASRPDPRKRIDITIDGFAEFVHGRDEPIYLCLHQAHSHRQYVEPLLAQVDQLGIADRVIWHPQQPGPVSDEQLNRLYNACALGINTALGEGFGLVSFEHAATGVPQILPAQSTLTELWGDSAWRLPTTPVMTDHSPLRMAEVDASDVALALTDLYEDSIAYERLAFAALARSRRADLEWSTVAERIVQVLHHQRRIDQHRIPA